MKTKTIVILSSSILAIVLMFIWFGLSVSTTNKEIDLRTTISAQGQKCETYFDKMWKILQSKAQVADQYKEAFKTIYPDLIKGRYSNGQNDGALMKLVVESNPAFDASLYKDLMQSIEIERTGFMNEQNRLIDLNREHTAMLTKIPSKWFLGDDIKEIEIVIITSETTENTFKTGKEDNIDLFNKK